MGGAFPDQELANRTGIGQVESDFIISRSAGGGDDTGVCAEMCFQILQEVPADKTTGTDQQYAARPVRH